MTLLNRSTTSAVAATATVVLAVVSFLWIFTGQAAVASEKGYLEVNEVRYEFEPSNCTFTETDFAAAGTGMIDDESFWISASGRSISLSVGTSSEVDRPDRDQVWMTSVGGLRWAVSGDSLRVETTMEDGRLDPSTRHPATLVVSCATAA